MERELVYVVHTDPAVAATVCNSLLASDYKVVKMTNESEAEAALSSHQFVLPDAILTPLGDLESGDSILISLFNSNPLMEQIPLVILANEEEDQRRRALRLGLLSVILPPYEEEEVTLTTRLAIEKHRSEQLLFGSLSQLSVPDLLQTAEVGRRSGTIRFQRSDHIGQVWLKDGVAVNAEIDGIFHGEEGLYAIALWETGTFEANFGGVEVSERFSILPSELLLEAMRRLDEGELDTDGLPAVSLPEDEEGRLEAVLDLSVILLNVATSYAANHLEGPLVEGRCEATRRQLLEDHPALASLRVGEGGQVTLVGPPEDADPEALSSAVASWLGELFTTLERALAWRFSPAIMARIVRPWWRDMEALGLVAALGLEERAQARAEDEAAEGHPALERALPFGCFVLEENGRIERCSSYGSRRFRFDPWPIIGQSLWSVLPPNVAERTRTLVHSFSEGRLPGESAIAADTSVSLGPRAVTVRTGVVPLPVGGRVLVTLNRLWDKEQVLSAEIERDALHGALTSGGSRLVAANEDFFRALGGLFGKTLADRRHALLHQFGKKWGLRHVLRVERFVQRTYSMTLREVESQMALELLSESTGVLGLGHFEVDLDHRASGVVVVRHDNSPFPSYESGSGDGECSILAGYYAALLSYLSGRQLAAREISCGRDTTPSCLFVVATEERLSKLLTATPGSSDYELLGQLGARWAKTPGGASDDATQD